MRLIDKYLPADYCDTVGKRIKRGTPMGPDEIFEKMFCDLPKAVEWLMRLRNALMKPFGLKAGDGFRKLITERNDEEIILSKTDSHLDFKVSIYCTQPEDGWQEVSVTTAVSFNNLLGRIYFIGIWIFHKVLVKSLFKKATR